jgi:hypothetical protein
MGTNIETASVSIGRFGYVGDDTGHRLVFPHTEGHAIDGRTGTVSYGAADLAFDDLEGRIDTLLWKASAAAMGHAWLRDDAGRVDIRTDRMELPRGVRLVRAEKGIEIVSPHLTMADVALTVNGPFARRPAQAEASPGRAATPDAEPKPPLAERLRFFDSLSGKIAVTLKVALDLPVLGNRTLDQKLEVAIGDGSFDFRALDDSLNWLEGQFLDVVHDARANRLAVTWRVPVFGPKHDLIVWELDRDASALAAFGRVPVRSLLDFQLGPPPRSDRPERKQRNLLESFAIDAIDVALSLIAPRNLTIGGGTILFGGDDQPGMVDLQLTGAVADRGAGALRGRIGIIDTTLKDVRLGPVTLTADRLCFDGLDHLEVTFDGFKPTKVTLMAHRVTATNLALRIG